MTGQQRTPREVIVIGAGIVGLSAAWSLQRAGVQVRVLERDRVAAGASAGNAGWISPGLSGPLVSREAVRAGLRGVWDPRAAVVVRPPAALRNARFLAAFLRNSAPARMAAAVDALEPINRVAFDAFRSMQDAGVGLELREDPIVAAFQAPEAADAMASALEQRSVTGRVQVQRLDARAARSLEPALAPGIRAGLLIGGQRWLEPLAATQAVASATAAAGAELRFGVEVTGLHTDPGGVVVTSSVGRFRADAVVVAAGAWAPRLLPSLGVRVPLAAGRGYRITVRPRTPCTHPIYLPEARLACTPAGRDLQVTGIMELADPDGPPVSARARTILRAVRACIPLASAGALAGWSGSRPLSADGLPLIGPSAVPGVHLAIGHGMYGMTLGPASGQLLARAIVTGRVPPELEPLDPQRSGRLPEQVR